MTKVISTSDRLLMLVSEPSYEILAKNFTSYKRAFIFTNACSTPFPTIEAQELHLHTAELLISGTTTVKTSGERGSRDHVDGTDANDFFFSTAQIGINGKLDVDASGGGGGEGADGRATGAPGGNGGNGGNGSKVLLLMNDRYRNLAHSARDILSPAVPEARQEALSQWVQLVQLSLTGVEGIDELNTSITKFAGKYQHADPGLLMKDQFKQDLAALLQDFIGLSDMYMANCRVNCAGGAYGVGGQGITQGQNGKPGTDGSYQKDTLSVKSICSSNECLFHPDQVSMTLRQVENNYFVGTPASLGDARADLEMLIPRLSFLDTLQKTDPLSVAYQKKEMHDLAVIPSDAETPTSITVLRQNLRQARNYLSRLNQRLDFYGHASYWVPIGSFHFYDQNLNSLLSDFESVEKNYEAYQAIANDMTKRQDHITKARTAAESSESKAKTEMDLLAKEMSMAQSQISLLNAQVLAKRSSLDANLDKVADEIKNKFSLPFSKLLDAATMMAFCPHPAMVAVQAASLLHAGSDDATDSGGVAIQKDYLVNKVYELKAGLDGLDEAVTAIAGEPQLRLDDPGATKLLGQEKDIMDLLNKYRSLISDESFKKVRASFDDYIQTVLQRNNQVMRYNACVVLWLQARSTWQSSRDTQALLGREEVEKIDSIVPALAVTVEADYFKYVFEVLKMLYEASQALMYFTLSAGPVDFSALRQPGFPRQGLYSALRETKGNVIDALSSAVAAKAASPATSFGWRKLFLTDDQVADLQQYDTTIGGYSIMVQIPPARLATTVADSPFFDCADVRIDTVRFFIDGATSDGQMHIELEHMGQETIVDEVDTPYIFAHDSIQVSFEYNPSDHTKITTDGQIGNALGVQQDPPSGAFPGPFTLWRVMILDQYNNNLSMAKATHAWFEFHGNKRTFQH